ncbi:CGNR zinc finger domain-containing protein [Flexivirga sp. B27]
MAQQIRTWDGQSWLLDPGALFLDFVYTGDFGVGPWREGMVLTAQELDSWLSEHVASRLAAATADELALALALRVHLTRLVKASAGIGEDTNEGDIAFVARIAAGPDIPPAFPGHDPEDIPSTTQALSTIARDAIIHLRDRRDRLRNCSGPDCPMIFLDLSRAGRRTWCSMARCGNRAKVRAFRSKTADGKNTSGGASK